MYVHILSVIIIEPPPCCFLFLSPRSFLSFLPLLAVELVHSSQTTVNRARRKDGGNGQILWRLQLEVPVHAAEPGKEAKKPTS